MRIAALVAGKSVASMSRALKRGSGTALPGLVAEKLHPGLLGELASRLPEGAAVVSGTNGKTTTSKMLGDALELAGTTVVRNDSGSNLRHGVASALVAASWPLGGRIAGRRGVFEVDEAAAPAVVSQLRPQVMCVLNVFRDQLDRFGDTDTTLSFLAKAVAETPGTVLLNADDPLVAGLARHASGDVRHFGLELAQSAADASIAGVRLAPCPACGSRLDFSARAYAHLGEWMCPSCGEMRPVPEFLGSEVELRADGSAFTFTTGDVSVRILLPVPGLHNVYNALAACAAGVLSGVPLGVLASSLARFEPAFGRTEMLDVEGRHVTLTLAKNPAGAAQSIASAVGDEAPRAIGFALNDNDADGRDVSWIWDVDFEAFDLTQSRVVLCGSRAQDLAVRLKYAGVRESMLNICKDPARGLGLLAEQLPAGGSAHMLASYTAMLEMRGAHQAGRGALAHLGRQLRYGA